MPETRDTAASRHTDVVGAVVGAIGLAGIIYALTQGPDTGWTTPLVLVAGSAGVLGLVLFLIIETRVHDPLLPLTLFRTRQFSAANGVTFIVYGALGGSFFLLPLQLQRVLGYSPIAAGAALLPVTVAMLLLSSRMGRLSSRIGPRLPMTAGPLVSAVGLFLLSGAGAGTSYLTGLLPGTAVFGLGLSLTVAPLTTTVLAAAGPSHAGVASAVNTDVARTARLLAVAALPAAAGLSGSYHDVAAFSTGFTHAMWISSGVLAAGGLLAAATIRNESAEQDEPQRNASHCAVDGPPCGTSSRARGREHGRRAA